MHWYVILCASLSFCILILIFLCFVLINFLFESQWRRLNYSVYSHLTCFKEHLTRNGFSIRILIYLAPSVFQYFNSLFLTFFPYMLKLSLLPFLLRLFFISWERKLTFNALYLGEKIGLEIVTMRWKYPNPSRHTEWIAVISNQRVTVNRIKSSTYRINWWCVCVVLQVNADAAGHREHGAGYEGWHSAHQ